MKTRVADVLVLGGGLGGVLAAARLQQAGCSVEVVEAQADIGGRLQTAYVESCAPLIELGGRAIGSFHTRLRELCGQLNVPLRPNALQRECQREYLASEIVLQGRCVQGARRQALERDLRQLIAYIVDVAQQVDPFAPWTSSSSVVQLDDIAVEEWLAALSCTPDVRAVFTDIEPQKQSVLALLTLVAGAGGAAFFEQSERFTFANGASNLIAGLSDLCVRPIRTLRKALACEVLARSVRTLVQCRVSSRVEIWESKVVIAAVSPLALARIAISPRRPRILSRLAMAQNRYVSLCLRDHGHRSVPEGFAMISDGEIRLVWAERMDEHSLLVHALIRGDSRASVETSAGVAQSVLRLCRLERHQVVGLWERNWSNCEWVRGTYSTYPPGALQVGMTEIVESQGRLLYVGDFAAPAFCGYMESVVLSADRAVGRALQILS